MTLISLLIGKIIIKISRMAGHSGTALAGKVMETINPRLLKNLSRQLEGGVVVVTGTNGKTTTTKMIVELLESQGVKVFTNKSGSNFTRGILSAMADKATGLGKLEFNMAVLELDEAYFKHFAKKVTPNVTLVTNLFRDQLDRYGEIATTARHIKAGLKHTKNAVLYAEDPEVVALGEAVRSDSFLKFYGVNSSLRKQLPNDNELHAKKVNSKTTSFSKVAVLDKFTEGKTKSDITIKIGNKKHSAKMDLKGVYNGLNATAALATVKVVMPDLSDSELVKALGNVKPAFGRGEVLRVGNSSVTLGLVKNPSGFNQNIKTLVTKNTKSLLISINDNFADGRDISWLWDVDVSSLKDFTGKIYVSGVRANDMALRLKYADVDFEEVEVDTNRIFTKLTKESQKLVVLPTYTCMLALHKSLQQQGIAEEIH